MPLVNTVKTCAACLCVTLQKQIAKLQQCNHAQITLLIRGPGSNQSMRLQHNTNPFMGYHFEESPWPRKRTHKTES